MERLRRDVYERELYRLQTELVKLQEWVRETGARLVVVFEGRDAAGKGSAIKRITEHLNPRVARIVALPAPGERERRVLHFDRDQGLSAVETLVPGERAVHQEILNQEVDHDRIRDEILGRTLWVDPDTVDVEVTDGVVTLQGRLERQSEIDIADQLVRSLPGVVDVRNRLRPEWNDTTHPRQTEIFG